MNLKHPGQIMLAALAIAWSFDFLFWEKPPGISFAIFTILTVGAGLLLARREGIKAARLSLFLLVPIAFFAVMSVLRLEPLTSFLSRVMIWLLMGLLAVSYTKGNWWDYSLADYAAKFGLLGVSSLSLGGRALVETQQEGEGGSRKEARRGTALSILKGLALALPVLVVFGSLLASADPIFEDAIENFLEIFDIEDLPEYLWRGFYILVLGYLLGGVYLHAYAKSQGGKLLGKDKPMLPRFLGATEAGIVLGSVIVLFAVFVAIQFRYFFGGEVNVNATSFTYAEYARRGFGELAAVAFFSLLMFLGLSTVTKRETQKQARTFSGLGIALVALVSVMLVSAFQRLLLYENAFGFTRARTNAHVFMIWLGVLLVAVAALEILNRQRAFALAALVAGMGFAATLNLLNPDAFIVRQNIQRAEAGEELDAGFLSTLSEDAMPALVNAYYETGARSALRDQVGAALACLAYNRNYFEDEIPWQGYSPARAAAKAAWEQVSNLPGFDRHLVHENEEGFQVVEANGEEIYCYPTYWFD
jgi:hypothetical protein